MRKLFCLILIFAFNWGNLSAQIRFEKDLEKFIDDLFIEKEVSWENVREEFLDYAHTVLKKAENTVDFFTYCRDKSEKFEKKGRTNGKDFTQLVDLEKKAIELLQFIEQFIFDYAVSDQERQKYMEWSTIPKLFHLSHDFGINFICQSSISYAASKTIDATSKIQSISLKEKLNIIFMIQHIFKRTSINSNQLINSERNSIEVIECDFEKVELSGDEEVALDSTKQYIDPCYFGGESAFMKFIQLNLRYPDEAKEQGLQGLINVSFVVNGDGTLSNFCVFDSPPEILAKEALRILKIMPNWLPGSIDGEPVRIRYTIPIRFTLA